MQTITSTQFQFKNQKSFYKGKVRDVYNIGNEYLVMVVSDRISAFDVVLPKGIPYKGQVLNQVAAKFLDETADIVPNWKIAVPDPNVTIGHFVKPFAIEMIVRGYLTGSSWRDYKNGAREICGVAIPDGMREHQRFATPIITPTTKAETGHDMNITREEIIAEGYATEHDYNELERIALALFERGTQIAAKQGLILVDTKYEFGKKGDQIYLIDEIHTPDSSRYFYKEGYDERFATGEQQRQLSKEFVREWLMENGFKGEHGQQVPHMSDEFVKQTSERYIELYQQITGDTFVPRESENLYSEIENNINAFLNTLS